MRTRVLGLVSLISLAVMGCGTPGAPRPPSLDLPKPVEDLRAVRVGDKVYLQWTVPTQTNDGESVRHLGVTRVCRAYPSAASTACGNPVASVDPSAAVDGRMTAVDDLPPALQSQSTDFLNYNVEVLNAKGKSAGPSNAATVFLAASAPQPRDLTATATSDGVMLLWNAPALAASQRLKTNYQVRIERAAAGGAAAATIATLPYKAGAVDFLDKNVEWEKAYRYSVVGLAQVVALDGKQLAEFSGEPSAPVEITPHDAFAPKAPTGVQAVYSGVASRPSVDLTWTPNEESDVAGYNLYRQESGAAAVRLNSELVKTPSYRDAKVRPGAEFVYFVTAVDLRGNESPRSEGAKETVPQSQ